MKRSREESDAAPPSTAPSRLPFKLHHVSTATQENVKRQVLALVYGNKRACAWLIYFFLGLKTSHALLFAALLPYPFLSNPHFFFFFF
jgi:hypothetical protein